MKALRFRLWAFEFRVYGFRVKGLGCRPQAFGSRFGPGPSVGFLWSCFVFSIMGFLRQRFSVTAGFCARRLPVSGGRQTIQNEVWTCPQS